MSTPSFSVLTVSKRVKDDWYPIAKASIDKQTVKPESWVIIQEGENAPTKVRLSNLHSSFNAGLKEITTDYVIFYDDFIELPPDCFEKLLNLTDERTLVTTCTPNYDGSDDGRYTGVDEPRKCRPEEWEINVAIAPMKVIKELGGFPEEYDNGWAWGNNNVAQRAAMLGCRFILDESNRPKLLPHEMSSHQTIPINLDRHNKEMKDIREGRKPLKYSYL